MWRIASTLREKKPSIIARRSCKSTSERTATIGQQWIGRQLEGLRSDGAGVGRCFSSSIPVGGSGNANGKDAVALQLDYYLSPQFAGVASALANDLYGKHGIRQLDLLPTCPPGQEQARVRDFQARNPAGVAVGTVEQNIFIPTLASHPELKTTAVAAMFHQSPLCIASVDPASPPARPGGRVIGAHEDTVDLLRCLFPDDTITASSRPNKLTDLLVNSSVDGIQAYTTTEVPTIQRRLREDGAGKELRVTPLEGVGGAKLGYSQVVFAADECLEGNDDRREVVRAFLDATFEGWAYSIRHPEQAAEQVVEAQKRLLDVGGNGDGELGAVDHWYRDATGATTNREYDVEMTRLCNDMVKGTFQGDKYGVIDASRWDEATAWLLSQGLYGLEKKDAADVTKGGSGGVHYGLDSYLWQPSQQLLGGNQLAQSVLRDAKASAEHFEATFGRRPSVAVLTVGELKRYSHGSRRLEIYSDKSRSWFAKTEVGRANNFHVTEINLDSDTTTTESLLSEIYKLQKDDEANGIQLMWPLPSHIDIAKVYAAIDVAKDVDGIHYVGQQEIGNSSAYPPVTPAGAMQLMSEYGVELKGKRVVVIGRSPIVGSPLALMCRQQGAMVTTIHSEVPDDVSKEAIGSADVVLCCAGKPNLIPVEWIADNATVINVGTTFVEEVDGLVSDIKGDLSKTNARYSPVPGGIGPLSAPMLFRNVAQAAWDQMHRGKSAALSSGWSRHPERLRKKYHFSTYSEALEAASKVDEISTIMDHHANMKFNHACVNGVDLELEFFTWEANRLTEKDYDAAMAVDMLLAANQIRMSNYTYNLKEESIAKYPASPRGSSKMLQVDGSGRVTYHRNFSEVFPSVIANSHLVFNESKVLDARLFVNGNDLENTELMLLDLGDIDIHAKCSETPLRAMIRTSEASEGDVMHDSSSNTSIQITEIIGDWMEDEKSDGNGTECWVSIQSDKSIEEYLKEAGTVPIPPYLHRSAEESDSEAYNNLYASKAGSVAAPTAGLHFTDEVLQEIGDENCSYLSLHVGAGTFKPVLVEDARDHAMHAEVFSVSVREVKRIIDALESGKSLTVVGTTSCRTLESLFWCGVKRIRGLDDGSSMAAADGGDPNHNLQLNQMEWIPLLVGEGRTISRVTALKALVRGRADDDALRGKTSLMICPPMYDFQVVDNLITNFHAPDSTLMLLVSGFLKDAKGTKIRRIYENAQKRGYRFLSYGDVCLFSKPGTK